MSIEARSTPYYPMYVSLDRRVCLVVGGGAVGERKVRTLLRFGAVIRLVARDVSPWLETRCDEGYILFIGKDYEEAQLEGVDLVFAAASDGDLNRRISDDARQRKIWCNMATHPEMGSFIVPSTLQRGALTIAISTGGLSPAVAKVIREKLEAEFGEEWTVFIEWMGMLRAVILSKGLGASENRRLFKAIAVLPVVEWIEKGEQERVPAEVYKICQQWISRDELNRLWDEAWKPFSS